MKREWTDLEFADWTLLPSEAALLANIAAGFVGDEVGTVAVPREKLKRGIADKI